MPTKTLAAPKSRTAPQAKVSPKILEGIKKFPWTCEGSLSDAVLEKIYELAPTGKFKNTLETGCGRSTLLMSHLSKCHTSYTYGATNLGIGNGNISNVSTTAVLNKKTVHFVFGPTQLTLPKAKFSQPLDLVLIDGPHGYPFPDVEYFLLYPHIATGGILIIDDIHIPCIHNLYDFLSEDFMWKKIAVVGTTAFFQRTTIPTTSPTGDEWVRQGYNMKYFPRYNNNAPVTETIQPWGQLAEALTYCRFAFDQGPPRPIYIWGTGHLGRATYEFVWYAGLSWMGGNILKVAGFVSNTPPAADFPHENVYFPNKLPKNAGKPYFLVASNSHKEIVEQIKKQYPDFIEKKDYAVIPL